MDLKPALLLFWFFITFSAAYAAEPENLRARYAWAMLPEVSLYFDLLGETGQPVEIPQLSQLTLAVDASSATGQQIQRFEETDEGVAYILLVDISRSLKPVQFAQVQASLKSWVQALRGKDRVAVMTFGKEVKLIRDFTGDKESLQKTVDKLAATDDLTQLHQGFMRALEMGKRADTDLPQYRVIVTLSDGQDDFPGGVTYQEVLDRLKEDRVPIYTLGFTPPSLTVKDKDALKALGILARTSGGEYLEAKGDRLEADYAALRQRIRRIFVAHFSCSNCVADGQIHRLQLTHSAGTKTLTDGFSLRLLPQAPLVTPTNTKKTWWPYAAGGIVVGLLVGVPFLFRAKKPMPAPVTVEPELSLPSTIASPTRETGLRIRLTAVGNSMTTKTYDVDLVDQAVVGRHPTECAVVITDDLEVSARHCVLVREQEVVFVQDLESRNGTLVNGVPIVGRHKLHEDDLLLLGRTNLRYSLKNRGAV